MKVVDMYSLKVETAYQKIKAEHKANKSKGLDRQIEGEKKIYDKYTKMAKDRQAANKNLPFFERLRVNIKADDAEVKQFVEELYANEAVRYE